MKIVITMPDKWFEVGDGYPKDEHEVDVADYLAVVAEQVGEGYASGHVDAETHWESTR